MPLLPSKNKCKTDVKFLSSKKINQFICNHFIAKFFIINTQLMGHYFPL